MESVFDATSKVAGFSSSPASLDVAFEKEKAYTVQLYLPWAETSNYHWF